MPVRASLDCVVARNTNTYAAPAWSTMENVKDVGVPKGKTMSDTTTREDGGIKTAIGTTREFSLEFEMNARDDDPHYVALEDSYWNRTPVDLLVLRGPNTSGTKGTRMQMEVSQFDEQQDLEGHPVVSVSLVVRKTENQAVQRYTVP